MTKISLAVKDLGSVACFLLTAAAVSGPSRKQNDSEASVCVLKKNSRAHLEGSWCLSYVSLYLVLAQD